MLLLVLTVCSLSFCVDALTEDDSAQSPRIKFSKNDTAVKRFSLPGNDAPIRILLQEQPGEVTGVGQTHLYSYNFQKPRKTPVEKKVLWGQCGSQKDCSYNITVVHQTHRANQVFVCRTNGRETLCCVMNLIAHSPSCTTSKSIEGIEGSIRAFVIKESEPSALVESEHSADFYITYSGSSGNVGIYKFGQHRVEPSKHDKEQHYVGLVLSRRENSSSQDRVYAFYNEKNRDNHLQSDMWLPFVTQVCTADVGGPKSNLQFRWTSQLNARLFCGNADSRQHFSQLVDVATVHADRWQDTRVYALFRNEWGMSAVCVYTIQDIDNIFMTSPFKVSSQTKQKDRPRKCVADSRAIYPDIMRMIEETSDMDQCIEPLNKSGPILLNHHIYTHIYADSSSHKQKHTVLFLSLNNGRIHKVIQTQNQTVVIAEYEPFNHKDHILSMILRPSSRKLYVNSRSELVQLNVANCDKYGDRCEDCVLARDPYCGWNNTHCSPETNDTLQIVSTGNHAICPAQQPEKAFRSTTNTHADKKGESITVPSQSKYFLQCPVLSHHAKYSWVHVNSNSSKSCKSKDQECLLLINSMSPEQVGTYKCVSEELGYRKDLAVYDLQMGNRAVGQLSSPLVWVCLIAALIKSLT